MRWIGLTILCLVLAAPANAAATPAEIAFAGPEGIVAMRADGSERHVLVAGKTVSDPAWSPDGATLAYIKGDHVMVRATAFSTPPKGGSDYGPTWSPDGTTIAFSRFIERSDSDFRTQIILRVVATGAERVLVNQKLDERLTSVRGSSWSPDGTTIAYSRSRLNRKYYFDEDVLAIPVAGGASRVLIRDGRSAVWSPDGRRIAYAGIRDHNGNRCGSDECSWAAELYVANADGSAPTRLTRSESEEVGPAWSPEGSRILFSSDQNVPEGDSYEIYSIAPDGSCFTWLTNGTPSSALPAWRPGSGDTFDPGSCDPNTRAPLLGVTSPKPFAGDLWLGVRYSGLLLSNVDKNSLDYQDCERFNARDCPPRIYLSSTSVCGQTAFVGFLTNRYRFEQRKGALLIHAGYATVVHLLSGDQIMTIQPDGPNRLLNARRVVDNLRPLDTTAVPKRLPAPRVPRTLARRLDATAQSVERLGRAGAARALKIEPYEVTQRLRLRTALRPYRYARC